MEFMNERERERDGPASGKKYDECVCKYLYSLCIKQ